MYLVYLINLTLGKHRNVNVFQEKNSNAVHYQAPSHTQAIKEAIPFHFLALNYKTYFSWRRQKEEVKF